MTHENLGSDAVENVRSRARSTMKMERSAVPSALRRIADVASAEGHGDTAARLRHLAGEWDARVGVAPARAAAREVLLLLRPGSGQLSDAYVRFPDGTPDIQASTQFVQDVELVRRYARRRSRRLW